MTCLDPVQEGEEPRAGRYWNLELSETLADPDKLPASAEHLFEVFGSSSLVKQRLRLGTEIVELPTLFTLGPIQPQILHRLTLMTSDAYLQPTVTPYPA